MRQTVAVNAPLFFVPTYIRNTTRKFRIDGALLRRRATRVLSIMDCGEKELSVLLVNDARMRQLNARYRGIDKPTDVLSFAQNDSALLGDVVISLETAQKQAVAHQLRLDEELLLLLIHGLLHNLGYGHEAPAAAARMRRRTRTLFQTVFPGRIPGGGCAY